MAPARTSPAANTPGTLVSRSSGSRCSFQVRAIGLGRHQVAAGQDESLRVAQHARRQPVASRARSDEEEDRVGVFGPARSVFQGPEGHPLDAAFAFDARELGPGAQADVGRLLDLLDRGTATSSPAGPRGARRSARPRRTAPGAWLPGRRSSRRRRRPRAGRGTPGLRWSRRRSRRPRRCAPPRPAPDARDRSSPSRRAWFA